MTREDAINMLYGIKADNLNLDDAYTKDKYEALKIAIEALEKQPCEDAISRAYIEPIVEELENICINGDERILSLLSSVKNAPPVTPPQKTGHWIRWYEQKEHDWGIDNIPHCKCSECGKEYDPHSSQFIKFCSECGAKMVDMQESESKE